MGILSSQLCPRHNRYPLTASCLFFPSSHPFPLAFPTSLDDDGGGTLDHVELQLALRRAAESAAALRREQVELGESQKAATERVRRLEATAFATRAAALDPTRLVEARGMQGSLAAEAAEAEREAAERAAAEESERLEREAVEAARRAAEEKEAAVRAAIEARRAAEAAAHLESSGEVRRKMGEMEAEIAALQPQQDRIPPLESRVGEALVSASARPKELVRVWDAKSKGEMGKVDFRQGVRRLGIKADNKEIDALFGKIEADNSHGSFKGSASAGTLELDRCAEALRGLQAAAAIAMEEAQSRSARRERLRPVLSRMQHVLGMTIKAEAAVEQHARLQSSLATMRQQAGGAGGKVDPSLAALDSEIEACLEVKRIAVQAQLSLMDLVDETERVNRREAAEAARKAQEREEAEAAERQRAARRAEAERRAKAVRERRIQEKNQKGSVFAWAENDASAPGAAAEALSMAALLAGAGGFRPSRVKASKGGGGGDGDGGDVSVAFHWPEPQSPSTELKRRLNTESGVKTSDGKVDGWSLLKGLKRSDPGRVHIQVGDEERLSC